MGFNLGAALGSGVTSALNMYTTLNQIDRQKAADAREEERMGAWRKEQEGKEALRTAASEVPTGDTIKVADPGAMTGSYDQQDAPMRTEAISPDQKMANFRQRALALGADPTAVQQYEAGGLQIQAAKQSLQKGDMEIKNLQRDADFNTRFDSVMKTLHTDSAARLQDIDTTAQTGGMKGLVDKFGPELKKAFGADAQLVGNNIVIKTKGQKPQTISNLGEAVQALHGAAQMEFAHGLEQRMVKEGLFKSPKELADYFQNRQQLDLKGREVATREALVPSEIRKNDAAAAASSAHAGVYRNMLEVAKTNKDAGDAMAPYLKQFAELSPEEQSGQKGQQVMLQAAAAGATKSKDVNAIFQQLRKPDRTQISAEREKAAYVALNKALENGDPKGVELAKAQYQDVFGEDPMVKAFREAQAKRNPPPGASTPTTPAAASAAKPEPAAQGLPLTARLSAAINKDNGAGNRNQFTTLASEVEKALPAIQSQIQVLESSLPRARTASEQANIRRKIDELKADLPVMQGIMEQRRAAIGY